MDTLETLEARCREAGLNAVVGEVDDGENHYRFLTVQVPSGSESRKLLIDDGHADEVGKSRFEEFRYIAGLDAIWSPTLGRIECSLRGASLSWANVLSLYGTQFPSPELGPAPLRVLGAPPVRLDSPWPEVSVVVGPASAEHAVLCGETIHGTRLLHSIRSSAAYATLQIQGGKATTHGRALELLQGLASTILFALERQFGIPVHLAPPSHDTRFEFEPKAPSPAPRDRRYEPQALELYWYGKTAGPLHLLGFLAFYQVLEYFFPLFSRTHMVSQARFVLTKSQYHSSLKYDGSPCQAAA